MQMLSDISDQRQRLYKLFMPLSRFLKAKPLDYSQKLMLQDEQVC